jgi:hypothetical protein
MCRYDFDGSALGRTIAPLEAPDPVEQPGGEPEPEPASPPETVPTAPTTPAASTGAAPSPKASVSALQLPSVDPSLVVGGIAVLLAALLLVPPGVPGSPRPSGDVEGAVSVALPPTGTIWFSRTVDPSTFEASGRLSLGGTGETVAFVGRFPLVTGPISVQVNVDGGTTSLPEAEIRQSRDMVTGTLELVDSGPLRIEVVDASGSVLASGTLLVTN